MKKQILVIVLACIMFLFLSAISFAQDINTVADQFYSGLADIIVRDMDNPNICVSEAEAYYKNNQDEVEKIRQAAQKAMEAMSPMIDKYMNMTQEEAEAMAQKQKTSSPGMSKPPMSPGASRYTSALKAFAAKYPRQAMDVAGLGMLLISNPGPAKNDIYGDEGYGRDDYREKNVNQEDYPQGE